MIAAKSEREVVSLGVDYVTATARSKRSRQILNRIGTIELHKERVAGCEVSEFRLFELEGLRSGAVEYATSYHYDMLRLSSHVASKRWFEVVQVADNVSRLDLQMTVRFTPEQPNLAEHVERRLKQFKRAKNTRLEIELRRNDVKGKTLYTGSRKSDLFSRLYDKGRESRLPELAGCWRMESQFQNELALAQAKSLLSTEDICSRIYALVAGYYRDRGAVLISTPPSPVLPRNALGRCYRDSSSSGRLTWLRNQVKPGIQKELELGNLVPVLEALGLTFLLEGNLDHQQQTEEVACQSTMLTTLSRCSS